MLSGEASDTHLESAPLDDSVNSAGSCPDFATVAMGVAISLDAFTGTTISRLSSYRDL